MKQGTVFALAAIFLTIYSPFALAGQKVDIYKKYNIEIAKPGEYPVTIYSNEDVPLPAMQPLEKIFWEDSDTLLYKKNVQGLTFRQQHEDPIVPIISVNLRTLEKKEIGKAIYNSGTGQNLCYDTLSKNIVYPTLSKINEKDKTSEFTFVHGVLGETLSKSTIPHIMGTPAKFRVNNYDCSFIYPYNEDPGFLVDGVKTTALRSEDGRIGLLRSAPSHGPEKQTTYLYISPEKEKKTFSFGHAQLPLLNFDSYANQYWIGQTNLSDKSVTIHRYDRRFNLVSEKTYPQGPWPFAHPAPAYLASTKRGYLIYRPNYEEKEKHHLFLLMFDGKIVEVLRDYGLNHLVSVSPDGCRAAFFHFQEKESSESGEFGSLKWGARPWPRVGILELCKN
jgi:hypothetical protein